jgi:Domain of unknown function (DUF4837)
MICRPAAHLLFISLLAAIISCTQVDSKNIPYSIGGVDELVVVLNEIDSTDTLFRVIDSYLGASYGYLPQEETRFNVIYADIKTYENTFSRHRNLVFIGDVGEATDFTRYVGGLIGSEQLKKVKDAHASFYLPTENVWSHPQYVETIVAADRELLLVDIDQILTGLIERISARELAKIRSNQYLPGHNLEAEELLLEKHNIDMDIPSDFHLLPASNNNFLFFRKSTIDLTATIMVYYEPYTDSAQLRPEYLLKLRDSLGEAYESSRVPNSYMQTEYRVPTQQIPLNFNDMYALESRGLWRLINDFMGGPFLNYWIYDETNNRMVYIDSYVYAPDMRKRPQVRQLEAVLTTAKFTAGERSK